MTKRLAALAAALIAMLVFAVADDARAVDDDTGGSFLNPFPEGEVYQVTVVGDTFAAGLLSGLVESFANDTRLNIQKKPLEVEGVMSGNFEDKAKAFEDAIAKDTASVLVVMMGEDDRVSLKSSSNRRVAILSPEWNAEYGRRLDRLMKAVKQKTNGVYWVGLPNLARADANEQAQGINELIRERAYRNGFRYVDIYQGFVDESGAYSAYGPDLAGKIRVLREGDGVHFTEAGNRKLAHFVEKELRRDMNQAKAERSIPLAGNEAEQAKINPDNAVKVPSPNSPAAVAEKSANGASADKSQKPVVAAPAADPSADQRFQGGAGRLGQLVHERLDEVDLLADVADFCERVVGFFLVIDRVQEVGQVGQDRGDLVVNLAKFLGDRDVFDGVLNGGAGLTSPFLDGGPDLLGPFLDDLPGVGH